MHLAARWSVEGRSVAPADRFGLPQAIAIGEETDDLSPFDPDEFAQAITGTGE